MIRKRSASLMTRMSLDIWEEQLRERSTQVAERWAHALAAAQCVPSSSQDSQYHLTELINELITALCCTSLDVSHAQELGKRLVTLGYTSPETLVITHTTLVKQLVIPALPEHGLDTHARLVALLGHLAVGFAEQLCATALRDHERICDALLTERMQLFELLRVSEHRLRTIVSNAPIVLFVLDRDGIFHFIEGKPLRRLGITPSAVIGQSIFTLAPHLSAIIENICTALNGKTFTAVVEMEEVFFETYYEPVHTHDGTIQGVVGVAVDVTRQMALKIHETAIEVDTDRQYIINHCC
jgi:PAS domain S-box-containing protein